MLNEAVERLSRKGYISVCPRSLFLLHSRPECVLYLNQQIVLLEFPHKLQAECAPDQSNEPYFCITSSGA